MATTVAKARILRENEFCQQHALSRTTAWRLRRSGGGPKWYRLGGRIYYDVADIERWLDELRGIEPSAAA